MKQSTEYFFKQASPYLPNKQEWKSTSIQPIGGGSMIGWLTGDSSWWHVPFWNATAIFKCPLQCFAARPNIFFPYSGDGVLKSYWRPTVNSLCIVYVKCHHLYVSAVQYFTYPTVFTSVLFCIWDFRILTVYVKGQPAIHVSACRADLDMSMHTSWEHACTGLHSKSKTSFEMNRVPCARQKNVAKFFFSYLLGPQSRLHLRTSPRNVSSCDFSLPFTLASEGSCLSWIPISLV